MHGVSLGPLQGPRRAVAAAVKELCGGGLLQPGAGSAQRPTGPQRPRYQGKLQPITAQEDKPLNLLSDFQPIRVTERQTVILEDGLTYTLEIRDVKAREAGGYDISVGDLRATRTLLVGQRFFAVKSDMSDVLCPTGAPAELCVALDDEKVDRAWFKYGVERRSTTDSHGLPQHSALPFEALQCSIQPHCSLSLLYQGSPQPHYSLTTASLQPHYSLSLLYQGSLQPHYSLTTASLQPHYSLSLLYQGSLQPHYSPHYSLSLLYQGSLQPHYSLTAAPLQPHYSLSLLYQGSLQPHCSLSLLCQGSLQPHPSRTTASPQPHHSLTTASLQPHQSLTTASPQPHYSLTTASPQPHYSLTTAALQPHCSLSLLYQGSLQPHYSLTTASPQPQHKDNITDFSEEIRHGLIASTQQQIEL
ncbi:unnamed protein product [Gadus morhua 'NCC']